MSNKLNDIEYDEVKILIIEELTKYANDHNGFVNNKYLESLDLFNLIDIDDIEEIKTKLVENQVEFIDESENLEDIEISDDLIDLDAKSFPMGGANLRIAQVNVVDPEELLARRDALEESMRVANDKNGYDTFVFVITNILTSVSTVLVVGDHLDKVAQAFNASYTDGVLTLPGVVSRKKQVVPPLTVAFEG